MITGLIDHLRLTVPSFVTIAHALSMEPIEDIGDETPAAYLYLGGESATLSDVDGAVAQEVTRTVVVFIVCRHEVVMDLRAELRQKILGYQADTYHTPCEFVGGETASIRGEWIWWQDTYQTRTQYREPDIEIPN